MEQLFYKLTAEPFRLSPDHRFCYEHKCYAKARAYMAYAFMRAEGFVMITGRPGTGKTTLIGELIEKCMEVRGKKRIGKKQRAKYRNYLCNAVDRMLKNISKYLDKLDKYATSISIELEKWVQNEFKKHCSRLHEIREQLEVSGRGDKSYIFPWTDPSTYKELLKFRR